MDIISVVCARCREERPAGDFVSKRKSAGNTKNRLDCRNKNDSYYSRSRDATLMLRNLASAKRRAPKRTAGDAGLLPPNERFGIQLMSLEKLQQIYTARRLFRESLS
ncbi:hypothetical protein EDB81DRAFT_310183 [Dactylonectria macrodidyma]|uniref:Uncharacterized protein n=2 Tax=Dactylonectria macrodidyma TaxID=307937 RepID=A0A9P9I9K7_9HYPO|nr:hypothetical protein EDB81DRAFT_829361 [Dactylonectria macrodidyma]KAH7113030.1 hypothetical protein EDB81DRAFT_310183 [Dactylonectria macrodidyma]